MPRIFFDLNLLANMVAKLGNIFGEHVNFDMFANNVGQFDHILKEVQSNLRQFFSVSEYEELIKQDLSFVVSN